MICNILNVNETPFVYHRFLENMIRGGSIGDYFGKAHLISLIEAEWRIYVSKITIIGTDNGLSPGRRQAIIWTNAGLLIGPLRTNFNELVIEIHTSSFNKCI